MKDSLTTSDGFCSLLRFLSLGQASRQDWFNATIWGVGRILGLLAAVATLSLSAQTHAVVNISIIESGGDVVITASGSADLRDLTFINEINSAGNGALLNGSGSNDAAVVLVGESGGNAKRYELPPAPSANPYLGGVVVADAEVNSGPYFGFASQSDGGVLFTSADYVSGAQISSRSTFRNQTLAALDLSPGVYRYPWGDNHPDEIVLTVGPPADSDENFRLNLEEPVDSGTASGVSNIRGWAIASAGIDKIEIFIDGQFEFEIPYGSERQDVEAAFPNVQGSLTSGFGGTFNYSDLVSGDHSMTARATAVDGQVREDTATFEVVRFSDSFIPSGSFPSLSAADTEVDKQSEQILIKNFTVKDGERRDVRIQWNTATQGFEIISIGESMQD